MELKDAFQVLVEALEAANKNGTFTLTNSTIVYQAVQVIGKALDLPAEEAQAPAIAEDCKDDCEVKDKE